MAWIRAFLAGTVVVVLALIWAWMGSPSPSEIPEEALELALPRLEPPYVVLLVDPLCPFCQELERALEGDRDTAFRSRIRILPYAGHKGSLEAWLRRAHEFGMTEEEMAQHVERVKALIPAIRTPTALSAGENGERKVVVGFGDYRRWKEEVVSVWKAWKAN